MKNYHINRLLVVALLLGLGLTACKQEEPFSQNYDIDWPLPTITSITPQEAMIESEITLQGTNLDRVTEVQLGSNRRTISNDEIVSKSSTEVVIKVPRLTEAGTAIVSTNLGKSTTSEVVFRPMYPTAIVEEWPSSIVRGQNFKIKGQNMDMLTSATVGGYTLELAGGAATPTEVSISTEGLEVPDAVTISLQGRNGVDNGISPSIPVEDPDPDGLFEPVAPVLVWNFEDGTNPFVSGDITPDYADLNGAGVAPGRGDGFLSIVEDNITDPWGIAIGSIETIDFIDLSEFHQPHLSFLVNTNENEGYFQLEITQAGVRAGGHFTPGTSSDSEDDYKFATEGWEWRSIDLSNFEWGDWWGDGALTFDPQGSLERITFGFKQGNGVNPFEIHLDHVMITDGPMLPAVEAFNFEDGVDPYSGSATSGINLAGVGNGMGANYLTVELGTGVTSWNWTGEIFWDQQAVDLAELSNPHLNLMVNTGSAKGYFQFETFQGNSKFGMGQTAPDYLFETQGEWVMVSLPLTSPAFSLWGGDAADFDPEGVLDYLKIGFTTGNVADEAYQISVDAISISDGPMW